MSNYLYNGVELPALPNWDKALYPYVYISNGFSGIGRKFVCFQNIEYGVNDSGYYCLVIPAGTGMSGLYSDGQWKTPTVTTTDTRITIPNDAFVWANFDVLNEDGSVYLAASEPVPILAPILAPTLDPLSLWLGWEAGNWVARQRGKKAEEEKTPVAYLYNGVRLPDIDTAYAAFADENDVTVEQAKEMLPYAIILTAGGSTYLYICTFELSIDTNGKLNNSADGVSFVYWSHDESWSASGGGYIDAGNFDTNPLFCVWSSHDILNSKGSVYLAASEPVPVYE